MDAVIYALAGALIFYAGLIAGSRLAKGQEPLILPSFRPKSKPEKEPEEQGWATRRNPFVEEGDLD